MVDNPAMSNGPPTPDFGANGAAQRGRLRELMLYIAERSADDPKFGATKLNKILYWSDFIAFGKRGQAITGAEYMKLDHGPVPRMLVPLKNEMIDENDADEISMMFHGYKQTRLVAKREPNLGGFTADQIAIVDFVIEALKSKNASQVSEMSHTLAWEIAGHKGTIPYQSVFLSDDGVTDGDREWANGIIAEAS